MSHLFKLIAITNPFTSRISFFSYIKFIITVAIYKVNEIIPTIIKNMASLRFFESLLIAACVMYLFWAMMKKKPGNKKAIQFPLIAEHRLKITPISSKMRAILMMEIYRMNVAR